MESQHQVLWSAAKWLGLSVAVIGLGAAAFFGLGEVSYAFGNEVELVRTDCGSILFPRNPNDALCNELRGEDRAWLGSTSVVAILGLVVFLVARRVSVRSSRAQIQEADLSA